MNVCRFLLFLLVLNTAPTMADLSNDPIGTVETLPASYPAHWVLVHDAAFFHMLDGRVMVMDADANTVQQQMQGMFNVSFMGAVLQAKSRPEIYAVETVYSKGHRGDRSDIITIYDTATLSPIGDILLPPGKRAGMIPSDYVMQLIDDDKYLLIYNFTPATSVSVVDIMNRKVVNEISLPSCALVYPTGKRGFSSLCNNASMLTVQLDENGQVVNKSTMPSFFDIDKDALFERPAIIKGIAYFPTFMGNVREVDLSGSKAVVGKQWSLVSDSEREENWRPGGMQLTGSNGNNMYVLMHPEGYEGSHKDPGMEVWVYDVKKRKRSKRIALTTPAIVIELTRDETPLLLATNIEMNIDVYDASTGEHLRTLAGFGQETPLILHAAQ